MNEAESDERPRPPARIVHEFKEPIVEELPRETSHSARESISAAEGDIPETRTESTADSPVSSARHQPAEPREPG
jgi:hypothetical protein